MSSHNSFSASGNSPTRKKKTAIPQSDFRVEYHGSICLLCPPNDAACVRHPLATDLPPERSGERSA
jgi:hypothetical protein